MKLKQRYTLRYVCERALPALLAAFAPMVIVYMVFTIWENIDKFEYMEMMAILISVFVCVFAYFVFHILRFLRMVNRQERLYNVELSNKNAVTIERFSQWIILSDRWLIQPGKLAVCRDHIRAASIHMFHSRVTRYMVRIKSKTGEIYKLEFSDQDKARKVRNWAKQ